MLNQRTLIHFLWSRAWRDRQKDTHIERKRDRDTETERKARHVIVLGAVHEQVKKPSSRKLKVNMRSIEIFHLE